MLTSTRGLGGVFRALKRLFLSRDGTVRAAFPGVCCVKTLGSAEERSRAWPSVSVGAQHVCARWTRGRRELPRASGSEVCAALALPLSGSAVTHLVCQLEWATGCPDTSQALLDVSVGLPGETSIGIGAEQGRAVPR